MTVAVSCCVIARGRLGHLRNVLTGLERQCHRPDEVVVVSMSDDEVVDVAAPHPVVTATVLLDHPAGSPLPLARARNTAAEHCDGRLLVFLDVDCIPSSQLVGDYVAQQRAGLLMGNVGYLPAGVPDSPDRWTDDELRSRATAHPARPGRVLAEATSVYELFWSLNFAVQRDSWEETGGFDESYRGYGGEDTDFAYRARAAGVPAWFLSGAEAFHQYHSPSGPPVEHLADIVRNARLFHRRWGSWPMTGWLRAFADDGLVEWTNDDLRVIA